MLLPPHIESHFREHTTVERPSAAVRALTDMEGGLGESYLLSDGQGLHVHSRSVGKDWLSFIVPPPDDLRVENSSPYVYLRGSGANLDLVFKFSSYEKPAVEALVESLATGTEAVAVEAKAAEQEEDEEEPTLLMYFAAALHALAHADTIVDEAESRYIRRIIGNESAVRGGFLLWRKTGTEALIATLAEMLDRDQRLCLMANLIELGMADDTLRSIEKETVRWFRDGLDVDKETLGAIYDVLVIKNRVAIFVSD